MSSFTTYIKLEKHVNNDQTWGDGVRANFDAIDAALHCNRVMVVDPLKTVGNLYPGDGTADSARRQFDDLQDAIDGAEGAGWEDYLILLGPGNYASNYTITKGVTIRGMMPALTYSGCSAKVRGAAGTQDSVFTLQPANGATISVSLENLVLENIYNADVAGDITEPYLIDAQDQATYGGLNRLNIARCIVRAQTWGGGVTNGGNKWQSCIKAKGNWWVKAESCQMNALDYGNGYNNGVIRRLFMIEGNNAQSIRALLQIKRCDLHNASSDDGTPPVLFWLNDRASMVAHHSTSPIGLANTYTDGGTGSQVFTGFDGGQDAAYFNGWALGGTVVM